MSHVIPDDVPGAFSTSKEFACPCCGVSSDGYCGKCDAAGCGETDHRAKSPCVVEMEARGWLRFGDVHERMQLKGGRFALCRIEVWRKPDGEVAFGRVLEVLS